MSNEDKKLEALLEQYKLYVQMADNVSNRRSQANAFYISVITGLLAVQSIALDKFTSYIQYIVLLSVGILGILLGMIWFTNLISYKRLNSAKFKVIHEMEKSLPFACFDKEWELLGRGKDKEQYFPLTKVEMIIPFLLMIPFIILIVYSMVQMI
jgi:heme/copper-type cytochrome/quinol oxidase subunit 4